MLEALSFDDISLPVLYSEVRSRGDTDLSTYICKGANPLKLQIPIVSTPMKTVTGHKMAAAMGKLGGSGVIHRFFRDGESEKSIKEQAEEVKLAGKDNNVGAAIGVRKGWERRTEALISAGAAYIMVDVAHGNHILQVELLKEYKRLFQNYPIIAANVADADGVKRVADLGAEGVRIGIGGGSLCTTRIQTGFGIPSASSIMHCRKGVEEIRRDGYEIAILQDGGIRNAGDIVKSLALGADAVIIGSLFVGCPESAAPTTYGDNQQPFKMYMGSASAENKGEQRYVEGSKKDVPIKWSIEDEINHLVQGIQSGLSYAGALTLTELEENVRGKILRVTQSGINEAQPHLHSRR